MYDPRELSRLNNVTGLCADGLEQMARLCIVVCSSLYCKRRHCFVTPSRQYMCLHIIRLAFVRRPLHRAAAIRPWRRVEHQNMPGGAVRARHLVLDDE